MTNSSKRQEESRLDLNSARASSYQCFQLAVRTPLYLLSFSAALLFFFWKRDICRSRSSGGKRKGPGVIVGDGKSASFGDTLVFLLGAWRVPKRGDRFVPVSLQIPDDAGPIHVKSIADGCNVERLGIAFLSAEHPVRRELLFAWSVGFHFAAHVLRLCRLPLPTIRVAAVVLPYMQSRDALLLTRRAPRGGSYNSMWVFPGGAVDAGETVRSAAVREVHEETGLIVKSDTLRFLCAFQARNENFCLTYLMLIYCCDVVGEQLRLQEKEVSQVAFLTTEAACNLMQGHHYCFIEGLAHGKSAGDLVSKPVALSDLSLAKDGAVSVGPGIGAGHWMALQEWLEKNRAFRDP